MTAARKRADTPQRPVERVRGRVEAKPVLHGTGSEHQGVVLTTEQGEVLRLQRIGANPFTDAETRALVGREVSLEGFRLEGVFRYLRVCPD